MIGPMLSMLRLNGASHVWTQIRSDERGTVALMTAFVMMAMMGMLALTIDIGYAYGEQRQAQNVADSAAIAATKVIAQNVQLPGSQTDAGVQSALRDAARKSSGQFALPGVDRFAGVYVDMTLNTVTFNSQPVTVGSAPGGAIPTSARGIRVTSAKPVQTFFASALRIDLLNVGARATGKTSTVIGLHPGMYGPYVLWAGEDRYICKDANNDPIPMNDPNGNPSWKYGCNVIDDQNLQQFNYRCNSYRSCAVSGNNPRWQYSSNDFKGYLHQSNAYLEAGTTGNYNVQTGNAIGGAAEPLDALESCFLRRLQGCTVAMPVIDWADDSGGGIRLRVIKFVNVRLDNNPKVLSPSQPWIGTAVPGSLVYAAGKAVMSEMEPVPGEATVQYVRLVQ